VTAWEWREPPGPERTPAGLTVAGGVVAIVVTAGLSALLSDTVGARVSALTVAVLLFTAAVGDGRAAVGVAVVTWAVGNGFLINQHGQLIWHPGVDTWFAMGLLGAVAVGMIVAEVRGRQRRRRRWRPWRELLEAAAEQVAPDGGRGRVAVESPPGLVPGTRGGPGATCR
jgi:MFS family permease